MRLLILGSGPSFVAKYALEAGGGPYIAANSCYTEPDFGYTLVLGISSSSEAALPSFASYDSSGVSVTADP